MSTKISLLGQAALSFASNDEFSLENYPVAPKTYLDRASALALAAASLALQNANLKAPFDADFGLSVGTHFGCVETMRVFEEKLAQNGPRTVSPLIFSHSYFNSPAAITSIEWGLRGPHATFCGPDCAFDALQNGIDTLLLGQAKRMLCGFCDASFPPQFADETPKKGESATFWVLERDGDGPPISHDARELLAATAC